MLEAVSTWNKTTTEKKQNKTWSQVQKIDEYLLKKIIYGQLFTFGHYLKNLSQTETHNLSLLFHLCSIDVRSHSDLVPLGLIGQQPECPSHLSLDSLSASPHRRPAG